MTKNTEAPYGYTPIQSVAVVSGAVRENSDCIGEVAVTAVHAHHKGETLRSSNFCGARRHIGTVFFFKTVLFGDRVDSNMIPPEQCSTQHVGSAVDYLFLFHKHAHENAKILG